MAPFEHQHLADGRRALLISDVRLVRSWLEALCAEDPDLRGALRTKESILGIDKLQDEIGRRVPTDLAEASNRASLHERPRGFAMLVLASPAAERLATIGTVRTFSGGCLVDFVDVGDTTGSVSRAKRRSRDAEPIERHEIDETLSSGNDYLLVTIEGVGAFISVRSIACVTAEGSHTYLQTTDGRRARSTRSLARWERVLSHSSFVRVHRSTILNVECVERVERLPGCGRYVFVRGAKSPIVMSRRYAARLNKRNA